MRFVQQIFPWPRAFPPPTRRALPASSPTSSVLCPCLTPRRFVHQLAARRLPVVACRPTLAARPRRGLPAPVQMTLCACRTPRTPERMSSPRPLLSVTHLGLPPTMRASALSNVSVSGFYRPARSSALLRFASQVAPHCARTGLPGGGLLPG